jgi:hypothetical protein
MIPAFLRGKLSREQENLEDLLTSCVFGVLRYLPVNEGLLPYLQLAKYPDGRMLLEHIDSVSEAKYDFWPWLKERGSQGAEPDVLIQMLEETGKKYTLLVEAKFRSGKSSFASEEASVPVDQLAREWDNLLLLSAESGSTPMMLYLTADTSIPTRDLDESAKEFAAKRPSLAEKHPFSCAWLSWRHLPNAFGKTRGTIQSDLVALVERLGLVFFRGISRIAPRPISWRFDRGVTTFDFRISPISEFSWSF